MTGTIKKKTDRGFGFIAIDGQDNDLFFHSTALNGVTFDELQEGAKVSFEVTDSADGRKNAKNVQLAGQDEQSSPAEEVSNVSAEEVVGTPADEATPSEPDAKEETAQPDEEVPAMEESSKTE